MHFPLSATTQSNAQIFTSPLHIIIFINKIRCPFDSVDIHIHISDVNIFIGLNERWYSANDDHNYMAFATLHSRKINAFAKIINGCVDNKRAGSHLVSSAHTHSMQFQTMSHQIFGFKAKPEMLTNEITLIKLLIVNNKRIANWIHWKCPIRLGHRKCTQIWN